MHLQDKNRERFARKIFDGENKTVMLFVREGGGRRERDRERQRETERERERERERKS